MTTHLRLLVLGLVFVSLVFAALLAVSPSTASAAGLSLSFSSGSISRSGGAVSPRTPFSRRDAGESTSADAANPAQIENSSETKTADIVADDSGNNEAGNNNGGATSGSGGDGGAGGNGGTTR